MIRYLHRLKARRGFTIVELIVVIAIMAVLMAVIFSSLNLKDGQIKEANSAARDFYAAMQTVMSRYSMYEGPLSPQYETNPDLGDIRYYEKLGGNYPYKKGTTAGDIPATTSLYVELQIKNGKILDVYTYAAVDTDTGYAGGAGFGELCKRTNDCKNTEFGKLLKAEIEKRISYHDGSYYAKVTYKNILTPTIPAKMEAETVKVEYAGYSRRALPTLTGDFTSFKNNNMYFGDDYVLANGEVFGVCAPYNASTGAVIGIAGTSLN